MIKDNKRYRNFMIVFEDDRYYICKASSFSKNGNNRYNWKDIETIDEAKKIIDKYWKDKEVNESMIKNRARGSRKNESCCDEDLEILNEIEDEGNPDVEYPKNPNLFNLTTYYMDAYDLDYDNAQECARGDLAGMGKYTYHELEATNPSNIGQFKRSTINRARKGKKNEDRIVTKDDEINKPTNVKDDDNINDTININVPSNSNTFTNSNTDSQNTSTTVVTTSDQEKNDEVVLTEDDITLEDKKKWLESANNEELLKQYVSFIQQNRFGSTYEDIKLTKEEILKRMNK